MSSAQLFGIVAIACMLLLATSSLRNKGLQQQRVVMLALLWAGIFAVVLLVIWVVQTATPR